MASDNTPKTPDIDADSQVQNTTLRRILNILMGKYDADPKPGKDPRDPADEDYIDPDTLSKKKPWSFPVKFWGYDGSVTVPVTDSQKNSENAHETKREINADDYAVSVMTRERDQKKAFAVLAFKGYNQGTGEVMYAPLIDVSGDSPKVSRDGVEAPSPIINETMFYEMIPEGVIWAINKTRTEILAIGGGNATDGYHWAPCDGGTYKSKKTGLNVVVPNLQGRVIRCITTALEGSMGATGGADTLDLRHWHQHTHSDNFSWSQTGTASGTFHGTAADISHQHGLNSHTHGLNGHTHDMNSHTHDHTHTHGGGVTTGTHATNPRQEGSGSTFNAAGDSHYHDIADVTGNTGLPSTANTLGPNSPNTNTIGPSTTNTTSGGSTTFTPAGTVDTISVAGSIGGGVNNNTAPSASISTTSLSTPVKDFSAIDITPSHAKYWYMIKL